MTTATAPTGWPNADELKRVSKLVETAFNGLDRLQLELWRIADDVEALDEATCLPTWDELGRLSAFVAGVSQDLAIMEKNLETIREAHHAAAVRMLDAR